MFVEKMYGKSYVLGVRTNGAQNTVEGKISMSEFGEEFLCVTDSERNRTNVRISDIIVFFPSEFEIDDEEETDEEETKPKKKRGLFGF